MFPLYSIVKEKGSVKRLSRTLSAEGAIERVRVRGAGQWSFLGNERFAMACFAGVTHLQTRTVLTRVAR